MAEAGLQTDIILAKKTGPMTFYPSWDLFLTNIHLLLPVIQYSALFFRVLTDTHIFQGL